MRKLLSVGRNVNVDVVLVVNKIYSRAYIVSFECLCSFASYEPTVLYFSAAFRKLSRQLFPSMHQFIRSDIPQMSYNFTTYVTQRRIVACNLTLEWEINLNSRLMNYTQIAVPCW